MRRKGIVGLIVVAAMVALAGCGDDTTTEAAADGPGATSTTEAPPPLGPEATGEPGRPTPADGVMPMPCVIVESREDLPSIPGAPAPPGPVDVVRSTPEERDEAVAIVLDHPGWETALAAGRARLVWATPWYVEDEVDRGVLLWFELDEPVDLPTDLGVPATVGEGDASRPVYDEEGLPVVEPVPDGAWDGSRSARLSVDLVEDRLFSVVASPEPELC